MPEILILNYSLRVGGGEKLLYELVTFALKNEIKPTILIPDHYSTEYYDEIFRNMGVAVIRTRLDKLFKLRNPKNILTGLKWKYKLKYFSKNYSAVHILNLHIADRVFNSINHSRRYFWHIASSSNFPDNRMTYSPKVFNSPNDTVVFISRSQIKEVLEQYGPIKSKIVEFKLFIN